MAFVTKATSHALRMVHMGVSRVVDFPILVVLIVVCVITLSSFLTLFFLIQHFYFGVSVIDFSTIINFLGCPITTHVLQTLFCFVSFIVAMLISVLFSYGATYILIGKGLHEDPTVGQFFTLLKSSFIELMRHSVIMVLGYLAWIFGWLYISEQLEALQDVCDRSYVPQESKYSDPFTILLYPLFVTRSGVILKDLRAESVDIMQKTFTRDATCQYSFSYLSYSVVLVTTMSGYLLWKYKIVSVEVAFLMALVTLVIYWSIIRLITIAFAVSVYHYCLGKDIILYPREFVTLSYKK